MLGHRDGHAVDLDPAGEDEFLGRVRGRDAERGERLGEPLALVVAAFAERTRVERDVAVEPLLAVAGPGAAGFGAGGTARVREVVLRRARCARAWGVVEDVDASRAAGDHGD